MCIVVVRFSRFSEFAIRNTCKEDEEGRDRQTDDCEARAVGKRIGRGRLEGRIGRFFSAAFVPLERVRIG